MKLSLTIDGAEQPIEILSPPPGLRFRVGAGPEREASVETPEPGVYSVLIDGHSYDAYVESDPAGAVIVVVDGRRFEIQVSDPRRWSRKSAGPGAEGVRSLTAPMPGKVVRVLVAPGDAVETGQGLVVVEAMKMQNEIKAQRPGHVRAVPVREGATVAAGETLVTIE